MRLLQYAWPVAAFMTGLGRAATQTANPGPTANLGIWDLDPHCTKYPRYAKPAAAGTSASAIATPTGYTDQTEYIQNAWNEVLTIVIATQESLKIALQPRPNRHTHQAEFDKWVRIADTIAVMFGFVPKKKKLEKATDKYWADIFATLDNLATTLQSSENNPAHGFNPELSMLNPDAKPLFACGDFWKWLTLKDPVPWAPSVTIKEYFDGRVDLSPYEGAFYREGRLELAWEYHRYPYCIDGYAGWVLPQSDMMILCGVWFSDWGKQLKTPAQYKNTKGAIKEGDDMSKIARGMVYVTLHEAMHWFGGLTNKPDDPPDLSVPKPFRINGLRVNDQQKRDDKGRLVYATEDGKIVTSRFDYSWSKMERKGLHRVRTYGVAAVHSLAVKSPAKAVVNADSLSLFCMMMYLDEWNWAYQGYARPPGPILAAAKTGI